MERLLRPFCDAALIDNTPLAAIPRKSGPDFACHRVPNAPTTKFSMTRMARSRGRIIGASTNRHIRLAVPYTKLDHGMWGREIRFPLIVGCTTDFASLAYTLHENAHRYSKRTVRTLVSGWERAVQPTDRDAEQHTRLGSFLSLCLFLFFTSFSPPPPLFFSFL